MAKVYSGYGMSTGPKIEEKKKKNSILLDNLKHIPLEIRIVSSIGIRLQYSSVIRIIFKKVCCGIRIRYSIVNRKKYSIVNRMKYSIVYRKKYSIVNRLKVQGSRLKVKG